MRICFGHQKVRLTKTYDGMNYLHDHLAKWTEAYGAKPQPEWVHLFCHTLEVIPMNWYLETKLRHGTKEWVVLHQGFLMRFCFEDGFKSIDEAFQEVKTTILGSSRYNST